MTRTLTFLLLCITGTLANPIAIVEAPSTKSDTQYRLDGSIIPSDYILSIKPYFDTDDDRAFSFDGNVTITFQSMISNLQQIVLHAEDLNISSSDVYIMSSNGVAVNLDESTPIELDRTYSFLKLNLASPLSNGSTYILTISYIGQIRNDMAGFYRSYYKVDGVKRWLGVTQFESTSARKALPCFDEPGFKATFQLSILANSTFTTKLSNTRIQNEETMSDGWVRTTFRRTPAMPTYLLAFLVSDFQTGSREDIADREIGIWSKPDVIGLTGVAFDSAKTVVQALGDYLGIDYYSVHSNLTFDHIAVPDFSAGAMENWGLITYREAYLIYDPAETNDRYKQQLTTIVSHETTHMWFGNLVTCYWWSYTWLNEGFANYFQYFIGHIVEPTMGLEEQFVLTSVQGALAADQVESSPPLTKEDINSPSEISSHFGTISYSKGGSIIRMIEHLIGTDAFKKGLNLYLEENRFGSGRPESLFSNLEAAVNDSYNYSISMTDIFQSWTTQAGFPLVTVEANFASGIITFTQERFYITPETKSTEEYLIPITLTSKSNFTGERTTKPLLILNDKQGTYSAEGELKDEWILANVEQSGFYRVNYDEHLWELLNDTLNSDSFEEIPDLNRAQIVDDVFALARADVLPYQAVLNLLSFLKRERSYFVWVPAVSGFNFLRGRLQISPDHYNSLKEYILDLIDGVLNDLGLEESAEDDFIKRRNRMLILELACNLEHDACIQKSVQLFNEFRQSGTPVPVNQRPMVYCTALRHGDHEDFKILWNKFDSTLMETEKLVILGSLGCATSEDSITSFLNEIFRNDSSIRKQDSSSAFSSAIQYKPNIHHVLDYVKENYEQIRREFSLNTVLAGLAGRYTSLQELQTFEEWLTESSELLTAAEVKAGQDAAASLKNDFAWTVAHLDELKSFLGTSRSAGMLTLSFNLAIVAFLFIVMV